MFIEAVPNRNSPPAVLLRESFRDENGRSQKRTLANLSKLPAEVIAGVKALLAGGTVVGREELKVERSLPHGHVAAALGVIRQIALDRLILSTARDEPSRRSRDLVVGLIVDRLIAPRSKLGFVRAVDPATACSSLGVVLGLERVAEREVYAALDWLLGQQPRIEAGLARRHLREGTLVLYDVSSSYFEGCKCPLARFGYSRDHRADRRQIVYGLLCTRDGLPIAVEVFDGNTADPATLALQIRKLKARFKLDRVVLVGDRGMITSARIRDDLGPAGLDWITCLRAPQIQALAAADSPVQPSLFDERDLAEITAPEEFPGERLIVCRNPLLAGERARKRAELLAATERDLARIRQAVERRQAPLRGLAEIGIAVGAVLDKHKMAKHFEVGIGAASLTFRRKGESLAEEARRDGIYVVRTSVPTEVMVPAETVQAYKDLAQVERAFRNLKSDDLAIRPVRHWTPDRVRAHVFLCMLAYHVEWHLRQAWAPLLFHDTDIAAARAERGSPVRQAEPSRTAQAKKATRHNGNGQPVMAFADLMDHLGTLTRNLLATPFQDGSPLILYASPTPLQEAAFERLGINPRRVQ
jgi:hypothetical protein